MSEHQNPGNTEWPVVLPQGVDGAVVRFSDRLTEASNRAALALAAALARGVVPGVEEASSALASVYARFGGDPVKGFAALSRLVAEEDFTQAALPGGRTLWRIPTAFGGGSGPALEEVAAATGHTADSAIADLTGQALRVLAIGFAPGQPYLGELPPAWNIPRLDRLVDVPQGAVVVAIRQAVLFANASPTGWRHVGQTAFRCFRPERERPFPLAPGDEVIFHAVSDEALENIRASDTGGDGGATAEALR